MCWVSLNKKFSLLPSLFIMLNVEQDKMWRSPLFFFLAEMAVGRLHCTLHICAYSDRQTDTQTHTHTPHTYKHTHTYIHTHTHTHRQFDITHTHIHTHTQFDTTETGDWKQQQAGSHKHLAHHCQWASDPASWSVSQPASHPARPIAVAMITALLIPSVSGREGFKPFMCWAARVKAIERGQGEGWSASCRPTTRAQWPGRSWHVAS